MGVGPETAWACAWAAPPPPAGGVTVGGGTVGKEIGVIWGKGTLSRTRLEAAAGEGGKGEEGGAGG